MAEGFRRARERAVARAVFDDDDRRARDGVEIGEERVNRLDGRGGGSIVHEDGRDAHVGSVAYLPGAGHSSRLTRPSERRPLEGGPQLRASTARRAPRKKNAEKGL